MFANLAYNRGRSSEFTILHVINCGHCTKDVHHQNFQTSMWSGWWDEWDQADEMDEIRLMRPIWPGSSLPMAPAPNPPSSTSRPSARTSASSGQTRLWKYPLHYQIWSGESIYLSARPRGLGVNECWMKRINEQSKSCFNLVVGGFGYFCFKDKVVLRFPFSIDTEQTLK